MSYRWERSLNLETCVYHGSEGCDRLASHYKVYEFYFFDVHFKKLDEYKPHCNYHMLRDKLHEHQREILRLAELKKFEREEGR